MAIQATQATHKTQRQRSRTSKTKTATKPTTTAVPAPSARAAPHRTIPLRLDEADADRLAQLVAKMQEKDTGRRVSASDVLRELIREAS